MGTSLVAAICSAAVALAAPTATLQFHHLHLSGGRDFYARQFEPAATRLITVAGFDALESGSTRILFGRPSTSPPAPEQQSAIWHFGWGDISVGETYLRHAAREVSWEPPLPADKLHLHLQSASPAAAAEWYRDVLGAAINVWSGAADVRSVPARPELRLAEAAVWFDRFAMVLHRTNEPLASTRGQRADHLALSCDDLHALVDDLRGRGVRILNAITPFGVGQHAMIEGPDGVAIELIESDR